MDKSIAYDLPVRTISEANKRGHWAKFEKLHHDQKIVAILMTRKAIASLPDTHPLRNPAGLVNITFERIGGAKMDSDNLPASMKYVRDAVAATLAPGLRPGRADGLDRFSWTYTQTSRRGQPKVRVTLTPHTGPLSYPGGLISIPKTEKTGRPW